MTDAILASILRRLDRLEQTRQGTSEAIVPTYLTLNPDGTVGALFTGGVQLLEAASGNLVTPESSLAWHDAAALRSFIEGYLVAAGNHGIEMAVVPDGQDEATIFATAKENGGAGDSTIQFSVADHGGHLVTGTLIDSAARSAFAQLNANELSKVGIANLNWPAAGSASNILTVALPRAAGTVQAIATPASFIFNPGLFDSGYIVLAAADGAGGVQFQAQTHSGGAPGVNGVMTIAYLMWGT